MSKYKNALLFIGFWVLLVLVYYFIMTVWVNASQPQPDSVRICHATSSNVNPYTNITVPETSANGFPVNDQSDHGNHNGGVWPTANWGDIIPPFNQEALPDYPGKNWTTQGQVIWNNGCSPVRVTNTPTPTSTPTPTVTGTPTGTPTPTPEPKGDGGTPPTFAGSTTNAPSCPDRSTTNVVANPHVLRNGESATVNFFITEGDSANIFYSVVGQPHWQHAVANVKPNSDKFVSYTIHGLVSVLGYDFGIQQKFGCAGGQTTAVVVDDPSPRLFMISYWE